jgi:hypothetical protein
MRLRACAAIFSLNSISTLCARARRALAHFASPQVNYRLPSPTCNLANSLGYNSEYAVCLTPWDGTHKSLARPLSLF